MEDAIESKDFRAEPPSALSLRNLNWFHLKRYELKLVLICTIVLVFAIYYALFSKEELRGTLGSASFMDAVLFSLNTSLGIGGFWMPASKGARATGVLQGTLMMLVLAFV